jgi:hypothetical protein
MRHSLASLIFGYMMYTPTYTRWVAGTPQPRAYHEHRVQLQLLTRRDADARRLVLKDPGHLWHLAELLETYPDALVVRLHRDPAEAVPSLCSLMHALQRMDSSRVDARDLGAYVLELIDVALAGERRLRSGAAAAAFVDVDYRDLVGDPIGTVRQVAARAGQVIDEGGATALAAYVGAHPKDKAGRHVYSAEQFGLSSAQIRERLPA